MNRTQKNVFIVIVVIGLLAISVGAFIFNNKKDTSVIKDQDTGEILQLNPEFSQQTGGGLEFKSPVTLFGISHLSETIIIENNGSTGAYFDTIKNALWEYSKNRLDDSFTTITVRPQDIKVDGNTITGSLRLGQTDEIIPLLITKTDSDENAIVTINKEGESNQYGGVFVYVSGVQKSKMLFEIYQKNNRSSDLVIKAYTGYKESALKYIESIGYRVPDFVITFEEYENPFI